VERTRLLLARAVGYAVTQKCDYGIHPSPGAFSWLPTGPYSVLLHASSGDYKLWDEKNWRTLGGSLNADGVTCVLPFGNPQERARSERLARALRAAVVPPALDFAELAGLLAGAKTVIGIDTGLTHLAAALGVPTVGIYNATDPAATGIYGSARAVNLGGIGRAPDAAQVMAAVTEMAP
jgi:heptosyltransferase-1